jgi:hypothetical protein
MAHGEEDHTATGHADPQAFEVSNIKNIVPTPGQSPNFQCRNDETNGFLMMLGFFWWFYLHQTHALMAAQRSPPSAKSMTRHSQPDRTKTWSRRHGRRHGGFTNPSHPNDTMG